MKSAISTSILIDIVVQLDVLMGKPANRFISCLAFCFFDEPVVSVGKLGILTGAANDILAILLFTNSVALKNSLEFISL